MTGNKVKIRGGFIQIPLLVVVIVSIAIVLAGSYGGFEYYKVSKIMKEAKQLAQEEKYNEAIEKLEIAQNSLVVKNLGLKKQKINNEIETSKKNLEDKVKLTRALEEFEKTNWQEAIDLFSKVPENSFYYKDAQLKIEEAKRKIVEEELGETKIAKKEAEEKAKEETIKRAQEELEREIAEQKLSEKEAEEKRMNADSDSDGLTYREELSKGTSDLNSDSDGDGIIDSKDTHPAGGGRNIPQTFAWSYGGHNWTWTESIQEDWYDYYKAKPRSSVEGIGYITSDDPFIEKISKRISEGAKGDINEVWLAVSFVQNLPYVDDVFTGYDEYPKYPVETFFEKNGDCEDTSYLTASIIDAMGYGAVLILLPGHMAAGVYMNCDNSGTHYELDGRCYYYIETTSKDWTGGEIPDEYRNTRATLIKIPSGKTASVYPQYVKPCDASSDFSGYYYDGNNYYSDNQCNNWVCCLPYEEYYLNPQIESKFFWDSSCSQEVTSGCYKSTDYSGYFYDSFGFYYDSRCIQKAKICRPSTVHYDKYWDGDYNYWDSVCTQKVVSWCSKSIYRPGYFFSDLNYEYYYDYQCTQKANL